MRNILSLTAKITGHRLILGACLLLIGCGQPQNDSEAVLHTDALGRVVPIPATVARVVTLAPSTTEIVFAAGAGAKVVGVTTADDYPAAVNTLPRYSALPVDFEAIAALEPDLVVASDQINSPQDAATLAAVGLPVYFVGIRTLSDMLQSIRTIGLLLHTESEANRAADSLAASLAALELLTDAAEHRPATLFIVSDATLYAFGRGSYMHSVIALAGGRSVTENHKMSAPVLTDEYVLTTRPAVIVGPFGPDYRPEAILRHHATWDIVPAVQSGRVYSVEGDHFVRPGPRLIRGAWELAALLHPDLVAPR